MDLPAPRWENSRQPMTKAVGESRSPDYLTDNLKALRRRLRAHGHAVGDAKASDDTRVLRHLLWEVTYEHCRRMLFARFLAIIHCISERGIVMGSGCIDERIRGILCFTTIGDTASADDRRHVAFRFVRRGALSRIKSERWMRRVLVAEPHATFIAEG